MINNNKRMEIKYSEKHAEFHGSKEELSKAMRAIRDCKDKELIEKVKKSKNKSN